ncbi:MAG: helix-turn-helix domain-containing protein [archaeon]
MGIEILEEIGLTKSEIRVYMALLELGASTTGKIIDKSGASSSKIYEILDKLIQKGLASFIIKQGVKYFEAAPPKKLMDYMEEKEDKFAEQKQELKKILPNLEHKRKITEVMSEATIYKGLKGIQTAFFSSLDLLEKGEEALVMGIPPRTETLYAFLDRFHLVRKEKKVKARVMVNEAAKGGVKALKNDSLTKVKYMPEITPSATLIFKDRTIIFPETSDPFLIVIDSKEVAESFRVQFEMQWNQDITVAKGFKAYEEILSRLVDDLKPGESYDVLGASFGPKSHEKKYADFFEKFQKRKLLEGKNVKYRLLYQQGTSEGIQKYRESLKTTQSPYKFLPYKSDSPVAIVPFREKSLIVVYEKEPSIVMIDNKTISQALKKNFELLWEQEVRVYKGNKSALDKFESMLDYIKKGDTYYVLGATYGLGGTKLKKWFANYHKKRVKMGRKVQLLSTPEIYGDVIKELTLTKSLLNKDGEVRKLPLGFKSPMQTNLYPPDKILMVMFEKEFTCIEIQSKTIYQNFKEYFDLLWNSK